MGRGMGRVDGKVALVTGGGSGIGAATARMLAGEGARVMLADVDAAGADRVAAEIGENAASARLDVTKNDDWERVAAETQKVFGGWHVLVNCAGILRNGTVEDTTLEDWHQVIDVNLTGTWRGCRLAVAHMRDHGGGSIINLSSVAGIVADDAMCAYDTSKGGVRLLTKSIALYCADNRLGVRCNSVHPGVIETPMVHTYIAESDDPESERELWDSFMAVDYRGTAEDVGHMIVYLASDESRLVTGAEMVIDGGTTAG